MLAIGTILVTTCFDKEAEKHKLRTGQGSCASSLFHHNSARRLPPGSERQQLDWLFAGFFIGLLCVLAPLFGASAAHLLSLGPNAYATFLSYLTLLVPIGFSFIAAGLLVALSGHYGPAGNVILRYSAAHGSLTLTLIVAFGFVDIIARGFLQRAMGEEAGGAVGIAFAVVSALFLSPVRKRVERWVKSKLAASGRPAEA